MNSKLRKMKLLYITIFVFVFITACKYHWHSETLYQTAVTTIYRVIVPSPIGIGILVSQVSSQSVTQMEKLMGKVI